MVARFDLTRVPTPRSDGDLGPTRVINDNFRLLADLIERAAGTNELIVVGSIDHGELESTSLQDDDHLIYHNDARALIWLGTRTTSDLPEGSNLYYTQARFDAAFTAKSTTDLSEGTNLYYTDARWDTKMAAADTGDLAEGSNLYYTDARAAAWLDSIGVATGDMLYFDGANWVILSAGTATHVLTANGAGVAPSWQAAAGGGGSPPDDFDLLTNGVDELIFADGDVIWIT